MRDTLKQLCESFINNRDAIKNAFGWESTYLYPVCAALFTDKGQQVDVNKMRWCEDILKKQVGLFSNFRGNSKLVMISMMAIEEDPQQKLKNSLEVYSLLNKYFYQSQYLPLVSMIITNMVKPQDYISIAERTRKIYDIMKKNHPFLTSSEDSVFATLLAISDLSDEHITEKTEKCYSILKPEFFSSNAVQALSHVLALSTESAEEKCEKTILIFNKLRERGYKYGTNYELSTLGVLAMLPEESDDIIMDLIDVDGFLSNQKGYGMFGIDKKQRLMHAGMLVASDYIGNSNNLAMSSSAINAAMSLVAAQQAATVAVIAASSAAAASAVAD
ncbi:MAG: DUF4003 family protein [Aminipila sp.]